jgi:hypothetical protein
MGIVEGVALLSFVAMLGWIVVEIAWRNPGSPREIIWDAEAFAPKAAPPDAPAPNETLLDFGAEPAPAPPRAPGPVPRDATGEAAPRPAPIS